ncbi:shikimate dehydrogenase [Sulfuritalea sp.]|uniref:shikimate dehydrogenase n=1 Tax=Sulfuritalea sp. TaxID=2480090 RepID=UPI00286DBEED|nr:shikimate dehydrogenase [Sulfuritalea sp.]
MTDRYAVFGNPIGHSKSPRIHALFAAQTGQDLSYQAILAAKDGFAAAVGAFIAAGEGPAKGANVTVPFKEEAFRLATRRTARAAAAGAVNTLSFEQDALIGDNTDGAGLVRDLKHNLGCDPGGRRILLLGAGGAARGVILPLLLERPAELLIANRTEETAARLALEFARLPDCAGGPKPDSAGFAGLAGRQFDLVINATSAGLSGASLPLPPGVFGPRCVAYEMVYGRETPFMAQARAAGARVADGLGMLVEQAAEAFFIWRGVRPRTAPVLAALKGN